MRLALLGISHETNTFATGTTNYGAFERDGIVRGPALVHEYEGSQSTVAGYLEAADRLDVNVVPLVYARAVPSGIITHGAFDRITGELTDTLRTQGPWDGVLLALHGAAVADGYPDADGETISRVRAAVGPRIPIGVTLDMHANVSRRMVDGATVTVLYRTNPHLDARARALECAELVVRTARKEIHPVTALETPPMLVNIIKQLTDVEPMSGLLRDLDAVLERPGMLSASVAEGYPYADVQEMGMAFLAVHDGDAAVAQDAARRLAGGAWDRRAEFQVDDLPSPEQALRRAAAAPRGPVVLMDVGDNIGGGGPADSTVLLAAARALGIGNYLQSLCDPRAVAACVRAGIGAELTLDVGGKTDDKHGSPVRITGTVRVISDGRYEDTGPTHGGLRFFDDGTAAVLETADACTLVLTSRRAGNTSIQQMRSLGIQPETKQVVVAKGVHSPRPAYAPLAAEIMFVNTPGVTAADLSHFDYHHRRRPLYPFERDATY